MGKHFRYPQDKTFSSPNKEPPDQSIKTDYVVRDRLCETEFHQSSKTMSLQEGKVSGIDDNLMALSEETVRTNHSSISFANSSIMYFERPKEIAKQNFFEFDPIEKTYRINKNIFLIKYRVNRKWLSYHKNEPTSYYKLFLGFTSTEPTFFKGMRDTKHMVTWVSEDKNSSCQRDSVASYIL